MTIEKISLYCTLKASRLIPSLGIRALEWVKKILLTYLIRLLNEISHKAKRSSAELENTQFIAILLGRTSQLTQSGIKEDQYEYVKKIYLS